LLFPISFPRRTFIFFFILPPFFCCIVLIPLRGRCRRQSLFSRPRVLLLEGWRSRPFFSVSSFSCSFLFVPPSFPPCAAVFRGFFRTPFYSWGSLLFRGLFGLLIFSVPMRLSSLQRSFPHNKRPLPLPPTCLRRPFLLLPPPLAQRGAFSINFLFFFWEDAVLLPCRVSTFSLGERSFLTNVRKPTRAFLA